MRRHQVEKVAHEEVDWTPSVPATTPKLFERDPGLNAAPQIPRDAALAGQILIIEKRLLLGECLTRCLKASGRNVVSFPDVETWLEVAESTPASLIVLCLGTKAGTVEAHRAISLLLRTSNRLPTVILSDAEDPAQIAATLQLGVRGYISTSMPLQIVFEALRFVEAGGIFVPASSLMAATGGVPSQEPARHGVFTARQAAVVEALRRGKANKIIAYELNMRESTVKVHIRNIMKKLKAKNRTEVAYMTSGMVPFDQ